MSRLTREQMLIEVARVVAQRSTCSKLNVGAVLAREGRVLSTGYNGTPAGMPHCHHVDVRVPCIDTVHAEVNAIAFAARYGVATAGSELYTTHSPCLKCAQLIINAGIIKVYFEEHYRERDGVALLMMANVQCVQYRQMTE